jgi:hypothetical protein
MRGDGKPLCSELDTFLGVESRAQAPSCAWPRLLGPPPPPTQGRGVGVLSGIVGAPD